MPLTGMFLSGKNKNTEVDHMWIKYFPLPPPPPAIFPVGERSILDPGLLTPYFGEKVGRDNGPGEGLG